MLDLAEEKEQFEKHMQEEFGPNVDLRFNRPDDAPVIYINKTIEADWRAWLAQKQWQPPVAKHSPHTHR